MSPTITQRLIVAVEAKRIGLAHYPYVFAAAGPNAYDCSGVPVHCWAKVGIVLPHNAAAQAQQLKAVPANASTWAKMQAGDLVFYKGDDGGPTVDTVGHVGMYLETFHGMHVVAQATNTELGTEINRSSKYEPALFLGYVR